MDSNFIPSLVEFKLLVNSFNFDQADIDLQSKTASVVGYDSLEHYLEFQYFILTKAFDINAISEDVGKEFEITQTIQFKGSQLPQHYDDSIEEELKPIHERVQKLPEEIIARISQFEKKLTSLFFVSLIEKNRENVPAIKFLRSVLMDFSKQVIFTETEQGQEYQKAIDLIDGLMMSQTNNEIQNQISPYYYFPKKSHLLKKLHEELVNLNYMRPHPDFESMFKLKNKTGSSNRIMWTADVPKLFYLLYRLNDKKEFSGDGIPLRVIAGDLFQFTTIKTSDNLRSSYNDVIQNFNNEEYLFKKMSDLKNMLDLLLN